MNTLCSFIIICILNSLVGGLNWTTSFMTIDEVVANWLERMIDEGNILEVAKAMSSFKARALTVTLWRSLKACWEVLK